jgi:hypothetical protein
MSNTPLNCNIYSIEMQFFRGCIALPASSMYMNTRSAFMLSSPSVYILVPLGPHSSKIGIAGTDVSAILTRGNYVCCGDHKIVTHREQKADGNIAYGYHLLIRNSTEYNFLEKLTVAQVVKKLNSFYGTRSFINMFKRTRLWFCIQVKKKGKAIPVNRP